MDEECEEGEILDIDEDEDVYTPLARPSAPDLVSQQPPRLPESESDDSPESSSDSDSSSGPCSAKKRKVHRMKPPHQSRRDGPPAGHSNARNKKYNIWSTGLQEEVITHELENLNGFESFSRDRGVESYDFTQAGPRTVEDDDEDEDFSNDEGCTESKDTSESNNPQTDLRSKISNKRRHDDRTSVKQRLGRQFSPSDMCRSKNEELYHARIILDLTKNLTDSNEDIARDMANKLLEQKEELIMRVVNVLGKEKAISLFEETQRVEAQGGMLIMNGSRRRSPGGVFLFILKEDDTVTHDQKNEIFVEDAKKSRDETRRVKRALQRKQAQTARAMLAKDGLLRLDPAFPDLLTRAELVVQQATSKKGTKSSDGSVSNPPPSPATDNRGESSNDSPPHIPASMCGNRSVADYQDDFLDVYGEGMDEF